jgi:cytochrome c biogenesis protein CcmG, thiol:disulfide interchange protein DsbE
VSRLLRWLIPLAAVPMLALLAYGFRVNPREIPSPQLGRPAAASTLKTFGGDSLSLGGTNDHVAVVNFWASWCYPRPLRRSAGP